MCTATVMAAAAITACVKNFVASLGIANSSSGYYVDELSALNGRLLDNRINLKEAAAAKVDDLTEQGLAQKAGYSPRLKIFRRILTLSVSTALGRDP
jgi:hypothetical protein